jgi:HlyD family secretion protein
MLVAALGCGHQEPKARYVDRYPSLETVAPVRAVLPVRIELSASIDPLEKAELCARIPGVVAYLPADIDIGRHVKAGELLIQLDVPELKAQLEYKQAALDQAKKQALLANEAANVAEQEVREAEKQEKRYAAEYAFARAQNERVSELVRRNSLTIERGQEVQRQLEAAESAWQSVQAAIETKRAKVKASQADIEVARSRVKVAEAEVQQVREMVGFATIRAPFDGSITKRWVDRGATIKDAGAPLLTVMNTSTVRVLLDIPEKHVPLVSALEGKVLPTGQKGPVELYIPALRHLPNQGQFSGSVTRVSAALDPNTRTMRTEVHLSNPDGYLKPSMYGVAKVTLAERPDVLTVPSTALARRGGETGVYVIADIDPNTQRGVVRWIKVDLGLDDGSRVEILRGLQGNEALIAKSNGVVREGDTVKAVPMPKAE